MSYIAIKSIYLALKKIATGDNKMEHITGRATNGLLNHYFPLNRFIITPEQIQSQSNKKPDFSVERLDGEEFFPHVFVEIKSLVNSNFNNIMDQLYETILGTVDVTGGHFSVYVIAIKGTKIAFFQFYSFVSLLDEHGILHYKGFVPLNQLLEIKQYMDINNYTEIHEILKYISKYGSITTSKSKLIDLGVESTSKIEFPHILDMLNNDHKDHVHNLFKHMSDNLPGKDITD